MLIVFAANVIVVPTFYYGILPLLTDPLDNALHIQEVNLVAILPEVLLLRCSHICVCLGPSFCDILHRENTGTLAPSMS